MANRKKEVYRPRAITEGKRILIQGLLQEYVMRLQREMPVIGIPL